MGFCQAQIYRKENSQLNMFSMHFNNNRQQSSTHKQIRRPNPITENDGSYFKRPVQQPGPRRVI